MTNSLILIFDRYVAIEILRIVYFRSGGYVDGSIRGWIVLCNAIANKYNYNV